MRKFSGHEFHGGPIWGTTSSTWNTYVAPQESKKKQHLEAYRPVEDVSYFAKAHTIRVTDHG